MSLDTQIQEIFSEAGLSDEEREMWLSRLDASDERMRAVFVSIFAGDAELLRFFTGDLKDRIEAGTDAEKLQKILESERDHFRSLLKQKSQKQ